MIRFIHTADIHLGMENYGRIDKKTGINTRLLDFYNSFISCVNKAIELKVDFFLFAGDAYKTAHPSPTQQKLLFDGFIKLFKANIPVVIIVGNHDNPATFGKAHSLELFGQLPISGFHVISKPKNLLLNTKNGPVQITGIPWPSRNTISLKELNLHKTTDEMNDYITLVVNSAIKKLAQELDSELPAVLAGHLTVDSGIFSGSEKRVICGLDPIFSPNQLAIKPFDYVALGHLHRHQNISKNDIPVVYSGSLDRIDFGERKEEKGFCLITIKEKFKAEYDFIKTKIRNFLQIVIYIEENSNPTETILQELKKHDLKGAIVKIVYHLNEKNTESVDFQLIQKACEQAQYLAGIIPVKKNKNKK